MDDLLSIVKFLDGNVQVWGEAEAESEVIWWSDFLCSKYMFKFL